MTKTLLFTFCLFFFNLPAQTFIRSLGATGVNDGATCITKGNGTFFIAGYSKDLAFLSEVDENGVILWRDDYDFTDQLDYITHIEKSGNKLIGCGYGYADDSGEFLEFYFKYDINSKTFDWIKKTTVNLKPATIQVLPNGNYLMTGDEFGVDEFRIFLLEIDAENGKNIKYSNFIFSGKESASTALIHNNSIYTGGRYGIEKRIDKYRGSISKFDLNFNEVWSNYYLNYKDKFLRNYLAKLIIVDEKLISLYFTNNHGVNSFYTACLAQQTLDGELIWASEFDLEGYKNITVRDVKAAKDGYYIYGFTKSPTENLFLIKTNKDGDALWAKTYGEKFNDNIAIDQGNFLEIEGDYLYMIGQSLNISGTTDYDALFMKLKLDGTSDEKCWGTDVKVNTRNFEELIQGKIFLTKKDSSFRSFNLGFTTEKYNADLDFPYICFPKLATNDLDTISTEKNIFIDFLANDFLPKNENVTYNIISNPKYGTAKIENKQIVYTQKPDAVCALDSFQYLLSSARNGNDTATIYIYTINSKDVLPNLVNQVLPEKGSIVLNAEVENAYFIWNTGETTASINVSKPGNYSVSVSNNGCISTKTVTVEENPYSFENVATNNITFLLDASSSMNRSNRLPILKNALYKIMSFMRTEDKLSMIKFSSTPEIIFNGINATEIEKVQSKIDSLNSEGRSNIKAGVQLSFETSKNNFVKDGNNRIIFTTDGDISSEERLQLIDFIKKSFPANTNFSIFLFNDASLFKTQMQSLADAINGKLYVVTPENVEQILLKELKEVRK